MTRHAAVYQSHRPGPGRATGQHTAGQRRCIDRHCSRTAGEIDIVGADLGFASKLLQLLLFRFQLLAQAGCEFHIAEVEAFDFIPLQYFKTLFLRPFKGGRRYPRNNQHPTNGGGAIPVALYIVTILAQELVQPIDPQPVQQCPEFRFAQTVQHAGIDHPAYRIYQWVGYIAERTVRKRQSWPDTRQRKLRQGSGGGKQQQCRGNPFGYGFHVCFLMRRFRFGNPSRLLFFRIRGLNERSPSFHP